VTSFSNFVGCRPAVTGVPQRRRNASKSAIYLLLKVATGNSTQAEVASIFPKLRWATVRRLIPNT